MLLGTDLIISDNFRTFYQRGMMIRFLFTLRCSPSGGIVVCTLTLVATMLVKVLRIPFA